MIKAQSENNSTNALQSSIVEAVSQATQNTPNKAGLVGKGFNMTLVVNPAQDTKPSLPVAAPSNGTVSLPAMPAGMEGMSSEYMAAVAVSL